MSWFGYNLQRTKMTVSENSSKFPNNSPIFNTVGQTHKFEQARLYINYLVYCSLHLQEIYVASTS